MLSPRFVSWVRHLCRPAAPRKVALALEALENRLTPSVSPNDLFVSSLYQGLLGRNADANGLTYWSGQLNAGVSRTQVAQRIATSNEAQNHDVELFYDALLNRPVDSNGLAYWTDQLKSGESLDQVKAGILGSNEFFGDAGNTNQDFLDALYAHELGRPLDSNGATYWESQLNGGVSRTTVADEVLASPEAANEKITSFYTDVLGRPVDAAGINYWSGQLQAGVPESNVLAGILGSNEYFGYVQSLAATTPTTDANVAAANLIASRNLFVGPLPNAEYLAHNLPTTVTVLPTAPTDTSNNVGDNQGSTDLGNTGLIVSTTASTTTDTSSNTTICDNTNTTVCDSTDTTTTDTTNCDNTDTTDNSTDPNATVDNSSDSTDNSDNNYVDPNASGDTSTDPGTTDTSDGSTDYTDPGTDGF